MTKKIFLIALLACGMLACEEKNQPEQPQPETTEPEQPQQPQEPQEPENMLSAYFINPVAWNGVFVEVSNAFIGYEPNGTWPAELTVEYGDSTIGADGLEHSGSLRIMATAMLEDEGAIITPNFEHYKVYGSSFSGRQTITNTGKNEAGNITFTVTVADGILGGYQEFVYSENTLRELVSGLGEDGRLVPELSEQAYKITGQMKMRSAVDTIPGYELTIDSVQPMLISLGELYPTGGEMTIQLDQPIELDMSSMGGESGFSFNGTVSIQTIKLAFTGKTAAGNYGAKMVITLQMGFFAYDLTIQCEMNEDGVIPESIQYQM